MDITHFVDDTLVLFDQIKLNVPWVLSILGVIWAVNFANWFLFRGALNVLGVHPRRWYGLPGIACSVFLHGHPTHLFFNTIPLFVLGNFVLLGGKPLFFSVTIAIILLSGAAIWLFGRSAIHIGASSLNLGYLGYLLFSSFGQHTVLSVVLGFATLYYFGGMLFDLFPSDESVSWEGHLFGFMAGTFISFYPGVILPWFDRFIPAF